MTLEYALQLGGVIMVAIIAASFILDVVRRRRP
jgi:hypothetical protein